MNLRTRVLLLLLVVVTQTYGKIYDQASQLPSYAYDYIVVGGTFPTPHCELKGGTHSRSSLGGTAGNVIANRLTENSNIQVLVLEAGGRWVARRPIRHVGTPPHRIVATKESLHPSSHS